MYGVKGLKTARATGFTKATLFISFLTCCVFALQEGFSYIQRCPVTFESAFSIYLNPPDDVKEAMSLLFRMQREMKRWKKEMLEVGQEARKTGQPVIYKPAGRVARFIETFSEEQENILKMYGWLDSVAVFASNLGYWRFSREPDYPYPKIQYPVKEISLSLHSGRAALWGLPNGWSFVLVCSNGKATAFHYTGYGEWVPNKSLGEIDQLFLTVLQGISTFFNMTQRLPETWEEVEQTRANLWVLPATYQESPVLTVDWKKEREELALTWFPGSQNEFRIYIYVASKGKPGSYLLEEDHITDAMFRLLSEAATMPWNIYTNLDRPPSGIFLQEWFERIAPVNPRALLWDRLASPTFLSGSKAVEAKKKMKPGQVLASLTGDRIEFLGYFVQSHFNGKPGIDEFALGYPIRIP